MKTKLVQVFSNPKFSAAIFVALVAVIVLSVVAIQFKIEETKSASTALERANDQIVELTNDIGTATSEREEAIKEKAELQNKVEEQAAALAAFAKQAAACEAIKKQIKSKK